MNDQPTKRFLSLGAGVQSLTLAELSIDGTLEKVDGAIFADTGWEPQHVYDQVGRIEEKLTAAGIPLYRVSLGNLRDDVLNPNKMRSIPAFTMSDPYDVTVVDEWHLCPDRDCGWRALRDVRDGDGEPEGLFDPVDRVIDRSGDMKGLFDSIIMVPSEATLVELDALTGRLEYFNDDNVDTAAQVAAALRRAGLQRLPKPHDVCRSMGRVASRTHVETRRDYGKQRRGCTQQYKLRPLLAQVRLLLGATVGEEQTCTYCDGAGERVAPWRAKRGETEIGTCSVCDGLGFTSQVGLPPSDRWAEQWIGFSTDEAGRVNRHRDTRYSRSRFPLIELDMSRTQCEAYLISRGWTDVRKSACIGCPFHGNRHWRNMRDNDPASWAEAVKFDHEYRIGAGMEHQRFLHMSCLPLEQAPIDRVQPREHRENQVTVIDAAYETELEDGDPDGCSPWACRSGSPAAA